MMRSTSAFESFYSTAIVGEASSSARTMFNTSAMMTWNQSVSIRADSYASVHIVKNEAHLKRRVCHEGLGYYRPWNAKSFPPISIRACRGTRNQSFHE